MKKVMAAIVTFIFSVCLITATVATASAASVKKVANFKASATPVAVTLSWSKSSDAKGYEIQQKSGKKWKAVATIKKAKTTTYTVKKLKNGTTYEFRIRAVNGKKKGSYVTVKIKTGVQKITGTKGVATGLKSVKLTWAKANVTGYEIQQKSGKKWKTIKKIKKASTTYLNVSKLPVAQKSTFRIRGYVNGMAKTYYGSYTTVYATTAVVPMKNVSVKSITDTSVTIGWSKVSGASGYQVQQLKSGKWVDLNKAVKSSTTQYAVKKLPAFTNQQFRVRAYQKEGKKTYYNSWVTVKAKTKISNVTGVAYSGLTASGVKISWKAAAGAAGYRVLNNGKKVADVKTAYANLAIKPATAYKITVVPYNGATSGNTTSAITFTSPCAQVTGVKVSGVTKDSVTISWSKVTGATGYQLQYYKDGTWSSGINVTGISYKFVDLSSNEAYQFRVRAVNKNGKTTQYGAFSATAKTTTKGLGSFTADTISWSAVDNAVRYEVEYYDNSTFAWEVADANVTGTTYTNTDIYTDTTLFRVNSYDKDGKKLETSNTASANISNVAFDFKDNAVSVSWSKVDGASSYEVRIKSKGMRDAGATVIKATDSNRSAKSARLAPSFVYEVRITAIKGGKSVDLAAFDVKATDFNYTDNSDKGKTEQLLYLVEAVNRTKFDASREVNVKSDSRIVTDVTYIDFGFQGVGKGLNWAIEGLFNLLFENPTDKYKGCKIEDGFLKCTDADSIDGLFGTKDKDGNIIEKMSHKVSGHLSTYTFIDGIDANKGNTKLSTTVQPADTLNNLAYLCNSDNFAAWRSGFSSVTTTKTASGYKIEATLIKENAPKYHNGFVDGASVKEMGDMGLGDSGRVTLTSSVGETVIEAYINNEGLLTNYSIDSPYKYKMKVEVSLATTEVNMADDNDESFFLKAIMKALDDVVIEMNTWVEGKQQYDYSFFSRKK